VKPHDFENQVIDFKKGANMKVNKIFGIGLSRTGTTSCYYLMKEFGFTAVHYPSSMQEIDEHFFCNDTPISARFEELDQLYPNSKFVYTIRSVHKWASSCVMRFSNPKRLDVIRSMPHQLKWWYDYGDLNLYERDMVGVATVTEEELVVGYRKHDQRVRSYFKDRPSDLLILDITDKDTMPLTRLVEFFEGLGLIGIPQTNRSDRPYSPAWKR
jgi:hypothetical protein